ncbi:kynureninase [Azospirillum halopraeferens]|uniref:kynureninase n=1 Tax=Azospirillum halopraeferens TaxID=34010 RepID=UPI0004289A21|nr:kynureninase [Azospirillum halopraeferens]
MSRVACAILDTTDPLAPARERFLLPEGLIYLDGNSLGPLPRAAAARVERCLREEWGNGLIRSWNDAGWIDLPTRVGDAIGRLIGAAPGQVAVADSTSINTFKALAAALALRPDRRVILSERTGFPTDLYVAQGLEALLGGGVTLRLVEREEAAAAVDGAVAVVLLTHVDYRSGHMLDLAAVTRAAHDAGALMLWDLAHSAGAVPVDLDGAGADLAVGCGYKYLNGGPGAPSFLYVAERLIGAFRQPLTGWLGHAAPFAFEQAYRPAPDIRRVLCGTPPVLSMAALEAGVEELLAVDMTRLRRKSLSLTGLFRRLVAERCAGLGLLTYGPSDPEACGSQVSLRHPEAYAVMQALIARGVVGDVRAPDILRFGFAPLYVRHVDVWDAVEALRDVLATGAWDRPEFRRRAAVT